MQARTDEMIHHERECFARYSGLEPHQIELFDVVKNAPTKDLFHKYDGFFMGGSGEFSIGSNEYPWLEAVKAWLLELLEADKPLFGSCFGHQILGLALGSKVEKIEELKEVGTYRMKLSGASALEPLCSNLPETFDIQLGHQDFVMETPEDCILLGSTENCLNQFFRVKNRLVYTSQFHPELDYSDMVVRINFYGDKGYVDDGSDVEAIRQSFKRTPESQKILRNFMGLVKER